MFDAAKTPKAPSKEPPKPIEIQAPLHQNFEEASKTLSLIPVAYIPPSNPPWPSDPDDKFLTPWPSFINDFAFSMKGQESPPLFNIFGALWAISAMSARKSYFRWAVGALWPNIYILFVADPSYCHKGAAPGKATRILKALSKSYGSDIYMANEKIFNFMNSNTSPEFLYDMLEPRVAHFIDKSSNVYKEDFGSSLTIWAPELITMISGKKYASGMIENFTSWFDCPDDEISGTRSTGRRVIRNLFITLIGALTPQHMAQNLPQEAYSTGFMSRCIVVYQQNPTSSWPEPVTFDDTPSEKTLVDHLKWLSYNVRGEYDLDAEARTFYHEWYKDYQAKTFKRETQIAYYARARFTQQVLRVATLLRMSEYRPGHDVNLCHIRHSIDLLEYVFSLQEPLMTEVDSTPETIPYIRTRDIIRNEGSIRRLNLLRRLSARGILVTQVNSALIQLHEENNIIYIFNNRARQGSEPLANSTEVYRWIGEP